jgi:ABC-2 type transport system permease protein
MTLFRIEVRRALRRRAVRVLIALAGLACVLAGIVAFVGSRGKSLAELQAQTDGSPAIVIEWWDAGAHEGFLGIAMFLLLLGAFFGGATVAGGEWRANTVTTLLTWEPRRLRVHAARTASAAVLAFLISWMLQVVFLASFLPAVLAHGTAAGADGEFWWDLALAITRTSIVTAGAAVLGVSLATAARSTAFAVISVFAWVAVIEQLVRAVRPASARWLWGENLGTILTWHQLPDVDFARGPALAAATLLVYAGVIAGLAALSFQRRDVTGAS